MPALPPLRRAVATVLAASLALVALPPGRLGEDTAFVPPSLESTIRAAEASLEQAGSSPVPIRPLPPATQVQRRAAPRVGAAAVLVEDFDTGAILYVNHGRLRMPIASLTKIMTAMLTIRSTEPTDVVTASKKAARQVPTKLGLHQGDRLDVDDLLYALLLHSSNDVAVALAEHVAGTVRAFDRRMTDKAAGLGMADTTFASPSGLNDRGTSTVRDLATLTRWAYRSDQFASIVATKHHRVTMPSGRPIRLTNLNDLLFEYPGAVGVKTGYTSAAHWSIVAVAERGTTRMLIIVLGDPEAPFEDAAALLDWAFARHGDLMGRTA